MSVALWPLHISSYKYQQPKESFFLVLRNKDFFEVVI